MRGEAVEEFNMGLCVEGSQTVVPSFGIIRLACINVLMVQKSIRQRDVIGTESVEHVVDDGTFPQTSKAAVDELSEV